MTTNTIEVGQVIRWFHVDWDFFGGPQSGVKHHDKILDALLDMKNAKESNSGHTGVNVAFEDDLRPNGKIINAIQRKLSRFRVKEPT